MVTKDDFFSQKNRIFFKIISRMRDGSFGGGELNDQYMKTRALDGEPRNWKLG